MSGVARAVPELRLTIPSVDRYVVDDTRNIACVRELLGMPAPEADDTHSADDTEPPALAQPCPHCGGRMIIVETFERGGEPRAPPTSGIGIAAS